MPDLYPSLLLFFRAILHLLFRQVKVRGSHRIPAQGPVIFVCAPHANQFVDPVMVLTSCRRRAGFLTAKKSMDRFWIGLFARNVGAIPVERPQDLVRPGEGLLYCPPPLPPSPTTASSQAEAAQPTTATPTHVHGLGTHFTRHLAPQAKLLLPSGETLAVDRVLGDTELLLKHPVPPGRGLDALRQHMAHGTTPVGLEYRVMPHVDHGVMFEAVVERLRRGEAVGVFPEGGSHDRTSLLPFKAGVTIMALSAMTRHPGLRVRIVPVGLNYFHADKFRSRAIVEYGDPIDVEAKLVEQFARGGAEKHHACARLLDIVYRGLQNVTLNVPDFECLLTVQAARRLYIPIHRKLDLTETLTLSRKFATAYLKFREQPKVKALTARVLDYDRLLTFYGLRDHQVATTSVHGLYALGLLCLRLGILMGLGVLALPGLVLNGPVLYVSERFARYKAREALAASSVKIAGRDVVSTWRVLCALFLLPITYALALVLAFHLYRAASSDLSWPWALAWTCLTAPLLPLLTMATVYLSDVAMDLLKSLWPLTLAILSTGQPLRAMRRDLAEALTELIEELGPEVSPDFMADRVVPRQEAEKNLRHVRSMSHGDSTTVPARAGSPTTSSAPSISPLPGGIRSLFTLSPVDFSAEEVLREEEMLMGA